MPRSKKNKESGKYLFLQKVKKNNQETHEAKKNYNEFCTKTELHIS